MAEPFLSELRLMSFDFAPKGWAPCNGQLLPINQNQALFALLGTTFGGDGRVNFALPDLQGRTPIHVGPFTLGARGGEQAHTLTSAEMPTHVHVALGASANADSIAAVGGLLARTSTRYAPPDGSLTTLNPTTIPNAGGSQAHTNLQPYLVMNWCIALQGIFPSPN
jgi:microcystin-dependent protein